MPARELNEFEQQLLGHIGDLGRQLQQLQQLQDALPAANGRSPRPKLKPSIPDDIDALAGAEPGTDASSEGGAPDPGKRPGSAKRSKALGRVVNRTVKLELPDLPEGARFKGYVDYFVQEMTIEAVNIHYLRAKYELPDGTTVVAPLPAGQEGAHFGVMLRAFIITLHHLGQVTQPKLSEMLADFGFDISTGQIDAVLTKGHDAFTLEAQAILAAGLKERPAITVDDTGARHNGKNGFTLNVSSPLFDYYTSTDSKSRINFLTALQLAKTGEPVSYAINGVALKYMAQHGLPVEVVIKLRSHQGALTSLAAFTQYLAERGIVNKDHRKLVTEGAMWGALEGEVHPRLAVVSDGARQFDVGEHGNCWAHTLRNIRCLTVATPSQQAILDAHGRLLKLYYHQLKDYKAHPTPDKAATLSAQLDALFTAKTGFVLLDQQLARDHARKDKLLLVLKRPDVPLHTNQSETALRDHIKKRKISGGTRSALGRTCRDTFTTLLPGAAVPGCTGASAQVWSV